MKEQLSYVQLSSSVNPSFWNKLTELILDVYKLDEAECHIWGYFTVIANEHCPLSILEVDSTSFNTSFNNQNIYLPFHGKLYNKNTIEQFKDCDKMEFINREGKLLYERIKNGIALSDPSLLNSFVILSFADIKKFHYYYWFAFPVPKEIVIEKNSSIPILELFPKETLEIIYEEYKKLDYTQRTFFLLKKNGTEVKAYTLASELKNINLENVDKFYFAFHNIAPDSSLVGSQLRNYVCLILHYCHFLQGRSVNCITFNLSRNNSQVTCDQSRVYNLTLPPKKDDLYDKWVGWEKNEREKMGPRLSKMKSTLDPLVNAENSVDLNLKLMKWTAVPDIDLNKIKSAKYLLLGTGTLGCSVARTLLAWGARSITFVDNSTVHFSNPVRQSLFTFEDSIKMKPKSLAAADNVKLIFPGIDSKGIQLAIPMPGHSVGESLLQQTRDNVEKITELISEHDVIFLLMDSRESRWLPTLLANVQKKIVINAALGFDTYLVMRHGIHNNSNIDLTPRGHPEGLKSINGANLGCYFCNDVTAPGNSSKGKTLDQQCTVTRPGVSPIAGALAVELAISVLQHNEGVCAPAFYGVSQAPNIGTQGMLGLVPHSIRGFLSSFEQILPATQKYRHCVACSEMVVKEYQQNGMEFLLKVFNNSKHLEDVTELTEMFKETDFSDILELSDEDF